MTNTGKKKEIKNWIDSVPSRCDFCESEIKDSFVDGNTHGGLWAYMCTSCHKIHGKGLGTGKGQLYTKWKISY